MWSELEYMPVGCSEEVDGAHLVSEQSMDVEIETLRKIEEIAKGKFKEGRFSEALQLLLVARPTRERVSGEDAAITLQTISNLGTIYCRMHMYDDAERAYDTVREAQIRQVGDSAYETMRTETLLAIVKKRQLKMRDAEVLLRNAFSGLKQLTAARAGEAALYGFAEASYQLGVLYVQLGKRVAGLYYFRCASQHLLKVLGEHHPRAQDALQWKLRCQSAVLSSGGLTPNLGGEVVASDSQKGWDEKNSCSSNSNSCIIDGEDAQDEEPSETAVQSENIYLSKLDWRCSGRCGLCGEAYRFLLREHHCRACSMSVCSYCCDGKSLIVEFDVTRPVKICSVCVRQGF